MATILEAYFRLFLHKKEYDSDCEVINLKVVVSSCQCFWRHIVGCSDDPVSLFLS